MSHWRHREEPAHQYQGQVGLHMGKRQRDNWGRERETLYCIHCLITVCLMDGIERNIQEQGQAGLNWDKRQGYIFKRERQEKERKIYFGNTMASESVNPHSTFVVLIFLSCRFNIFNIIISPRFFAVTSLFSGLLRICLYSDETLMNHWRGPTSTILPRSTTWWHLKFLGWLHQVLCWLPQVLLRT